MTHRWLLLLIVLAPLSALGSASPSVAFVEPTPLADDAAIVVGDSTVTARAVAGSAPLARVDILYELLAGPMTILASCAGESIELVCSWTDPEDGGMQSPAIAYRDLLAVATAEDGSSATASLRVIRVDRGALAHIG